MMKTRGVQWEKPKIDQTIVPLPMTIVGLDVPIIEHAGIDQENISSRLSKGLLVFVGFIPDLGSSSTRPIPRWLIRALKAKKTKTM